MRNLLPIVVGLFLFQLPTPAFPIINTLPDDQGTVIAALNALENAGFCADVINLIEAGDLAEARSMLEAKLEKSIRDADGLRYSSYYPNAETFPELTEGFSRASDLAKRWGDEEINGASGRVYEKLHGPNPWATPVPERQAE